jgi:DNA-binding MarR family transcriptional regulator
VRKQISSSAGELEALLHQLSETERRITQRLSDVLAAEDTSVAQWRVLAFLAGESGQPMNELARYTLLPAPSATRAIDGMVLDGLVYRTIDEHDRRRVLVHITAAGRARHRRLVDRIEHDADTIVTPGDAACLRRVARLLSGLARP